MNPSTSSPGLVLEGGGLRGVYTSGVLEALCELGLGFRQVVGTSMGAGNGANFVSGQAWRNRVVNIRFVRDPRWFSWWRLLRTGEAFGMDFIYGEVPLRLVPFDFTAFRASAIGWWCTLTDCLSGEALHVSRDELSDPELMCVLRAATSLPWIGQPVDFRGRQVMDGGLVDSIPLAASEALGCERNLVVLTQVAGYRKQPSSAGWALRRRHPGCPGLWKALAARHTQYNAALDLCEARRGEGRVLILRPGSTAGVGRLTRDPARLEALCELGRRECLQRRDELLAWAEGA